MIAYTRPQVFISKTPNVNYKPYERHLAWISSINQWTKSTYTYVASKGDNLKRGHFFIFHPKPRLNCKKPTIKRPLFLEASYIIMMNLWKQILSKVGTYLFLQRPLFIKQNLKVQIMQLIGTLSFSVKSWFIISESTFMDYIMLNQLNVNFPTIYIWLDLTKNNPGPDTRVLQVVELLYTHQPVPVHRLQLTYRR